MSTKSSLLFRLHSEHATPGNIRFFLVRRLSKLRRFTPVHHSCCNAIRRITVRYGVDILALRRRPRHFRKIMLKLKKENVWSWLRYTAASLLYGIHMPLSVLTLLKRLACCCRHFWRWLLRCTRFLIICTQAWIERRFRGPLIRSFS